MATANAAARQRVDNERMMLRFDSQVRNSAAARYRNYANGGRTLIQTSPWEHGLTNGLPVQA
jgi:hypothetical protein